MVGMELASQVRWSNGGFQLGSRVSVGDKVLPLVLVRLYRLLGWFLVGTAIQQLAVDVTRHSIGRLRPHFLELCRPAEWRPVNACINPTLYTPNHRDCYLGNYIEEFVCCFNTSVATPNKLLELRLSFPSGHSSFAFYTMVYLALYLHYVPKKCHHRMLIPVFQALLIGAAWFTSLSQISDYKHHPTDVLGGAIIGLGILALVVSVGIFGLDFPVTECWYLWSELSCD
ncbi:PPAP2A [Cordylochernes scorpioides]|uniref:PPAP2A n=1 Tax=Cordylochernes scorpioides TaxID=51811 RepID=A0ABY6K3L2_9ARAC|nr:PPAP2A [Cordylochernes scorpioides]